jgi:hypothetical protein
MKQLPFHLPAPPALERSPELAPLAILDAALTACEAALLASYAEIFHGVGEHLRTSSLQRASVVITQARRLGTVLASYREAVDRDARREDRQRRRCAF